MGDALRPTPHAPRTGAHAACREAQKTHALQGQLLFVAVQALLLVAALLTSGILSTLCWAIFAGVTIAKYVGVVRTARRKKRERQRQG